MANSLANWAETTLKVVDQGGDCVHRVRLLSTDGTVWQTWDAPFNDVAEWLQSAESLLQDLGDEFSGEVQLVFVAESRAGTQRSQFLKRVNGRKRPAAGGGTFGLGAQAAPLQAMYDAQAKTVERTLQSANVQLEVLTRTVEAQAKANGELLEYIRVAQERDALNANSQVTAKINDAVGELLTAAPALLELVLASRKTAKPVAAAASAVKTAITDTAIEAATEAIATGAKAVLTQATK